MRYILNNTTDAGCIPCDEVKRNNDRINYIYFLGAHSSVIMNRYSYNNGHLLIVQHTHESDIEKLPEEELSALMKVTQAIVKMLKRVLSPDGFNVGDNIGKISGCGDPPAPRCADGATSIGNTSYITVFDNTHVMPELFDETYQLLRPDFERLKS